MVGWPETGAAGAWASVAPTPAATTRVDTYGSVDGAYVWSSSACSALNIRRAN